MVSRGTEFRVLVEIDAANKRLFILVCGFTYRNCKCIFIA